MNLACNSSDYRKPVREKHVTNSVRELPFSAVGGGGEEGEGQLWFPYTLQDSLFHTKSYT